VFLLGSVCYFFLWNTIGHFESRIIAQNNNKNMAKLIIGMPKKEALRIMGIPATIEAYSMGDHVIEFLFYRTKEFAAYLNDNENNFTPVAIESNSGTLVGMGRSFYDAVLDSLRK
jgi:hypothetical protein